MKLNSYSPFIVDPSNLNILNKTETGLLYGVVGRQLTVECTVKSGIPLESIMWMSENALLKVGEGGSLTWTFSPTALDDGRNYTCLANNSDVFVNDTVQLKLKRLYILTLIYSF